jgi:O-antigen/teichoic acid export membrane protein
MISKLQFILKKNSKFYIRVLWRTLQTFSKQSIGVLLLYFTANLLTKEDFGRYSYILTIIGLITILCDFGISAATSKFITEYNETSPDEIKKIIGNSLLALLSISIICIVLLYIFGNIMLAQYKGQFIFISLLLLLLPLTALYDGIYRGLNKFKEIALISLISGIISVFLTYLLTLKFGINGALISQIIYNVIAFTGLIILYPNAEFVFNQKILKKVLSYSLIIGIGNIGSFLYSRIDLLFLGHYGYITEIGYYEIAYRVLSFMLIPFIIIAQVLAPIVTRSYSRGESNNIKRLFSLNILVSFIGAVIVTGVIIVFSSFGLEILFPQYNTPAMKHILILLLPVFFTQVLNTITPSGFVYATGHAKLSTIFLIIFGTMNVILDYLFINLYGYLGILYATILIKVSADLLFIYYYKKKLWVQELKTN